MNIGFNAHLLSFSKDYRTTGIGLYVKHLLQGLHELDIPMTVYSSDPAVKDIFPRFNHRISRIETKDPKKRIMWEQAVLPVILRADNIDLYHCPMHVIPFIRRDKTKYIITVHDLANFKFPQFYRGAKQRYLTTMTAYSARRADGIIAVSENTKKDLITCCQVQDHRIHVVHNGLNVPSTNKDQDQINDIAGQLNLPEQYVLFVGTMEPRKNIGSVVKALTMIGQQKGTYYPLVIVGPKGWLYEDIDQQLNNYSTRGIVLHLNYISTEELAVVYKKATLFVYPSFYEGFGFPVLEAMSLGTPVVCSGTSSLPEVGGQAAEYFEPNDSEQLSKIIIQLMKDPVKRELMSRKGLLQSRQFSWTRSAKQTAVVYKQLVS